MSDTAHGDYARYLPDIDVVDGVSRIMDNKKLYLSLLKKFKARQMSEDLINKINANEDPEQISQGAHAIKGAAGNLGLTRLSQTAIEIEARIKNKEDCSDLVLPLNEALVSAERAIAELFENEGV